MSRLEEIAARVAATTPGPWKHGPLWWEVWSQRPDGSMDERVAETPTVSDLEHTGAVSRRDAHEPDAAFIAAARDDVPFLLAEIERRDELLQVIYLGVSVGCLSEDLMEAVEQFINPRLDALLGLTRGRSR